MANMTSSVSASQVAGELASATFEEIPALVEHYREDPRQQVIKACERALKRHAKELAERERVNDMYELMHELGGDGVVVGVDEWKVIDRKKSHNLQKRQRKRTR